MNNVETNNQESIKQARQRTKQSENIKDQKEERKSLKSVRRNGKVRGTEKKKAKGEQKRVRCRRKLNCMCTKP